MKKFLIFLMSSFLVVSLAGIAFSSPIPFQIGTGGSLSYSDTSGYSLWNSYDVLGTDQFMLNEGASKEIDFFKINAPFASASGTIHADIELITPNVAGNINNSGFFTVKSKFLISNGSLIWDTPSEIPYSYNGLTNGLLLLTLNDIDQGWQWGHNFTISGTLTNVTSSVPEPATILLMGAGFAGMVVFRKRRRFNN